MARYKPVDRHLSKLLPVKFSEQIIPGTFEYALNWLVDHQIDLSVFDARYRNDETGASAYDPAVLLKIVLLGYARGLTSSRNIERACRENVVFMALSGDTQPRFTTIASFVARMPAEITAVFRDVLLVCDEQGLIGKELFAVDGCKLPSNASRTWSGTRADLLKKAEKMEKAIAHMLDAHRRQDAGQNVDTLTLREQQQIETLTKNSRKIRQWLAVSPEKTNRRGEPLKSNLTDNDSATMKTSHGVVQGYTGVAAVDARAQVIVHAGAFGTGQENGLLPEVLTKVREDFSAIGRHDPLASATVLTDSGYHSEATLQQLSDAGVDALVADTGFRSRDPRYAEAYRHKPPEKRRQPGERRSKWFVRADFDYDAEHQTCVCPNGNRLKLSTAHAVIKGRRGVSFEGTREICGACPLKVMCLRKPEVSPYRQVTFFDGSKVKDTHPNTRAMKARIDTREGRLLYSQRLGIVEPVFGHLHAKGLRRFTLRSRRKVDTQWKLFALVHNVRKLQGRAP
jgi:transposase